MAAADPSSDILEAGVRVPSHVVYRSFEGETLLLNLDSGQYHGLNETGGRMLELMKETAGTIREAIAKLAEEYEVDAAEIEPDLTAFCRDLADRGLVEIVPAGGDRAAP
jgi:hypothetical protein